VSEHSWDSTSAEAARLVFGDRGAIYDHPAIDYSRTAEIFAAITGHELTVREAVLFMVAVKLSRIGAALEHDFGAATVRDSIVDAAGYLDCLFGVWDVETNMNLDDVLTEFGHLLDETDDE